MNTVSPAVYNDLQGLNRLKAASADAPKEALGEAARQFEALFVSMMVKAMRDTLPKDGMFSSNSMNTYQEMFDQQLALDLSGRGGLGLAGLIEKQLTAGVGAGAAQAGADEPLESGTNPATGAVTQAAGQPDLQRAAGLNAYRQSGNAQQGQ